MSKRLRRLWRGYRTAGGLPYELMTAILCLVIGVLVMPCLIFIAGRMVLGPYAPGGVFALWRSFIEGLSAGSQSSWYIALGPYLFVLFVRFGRKLLHN